MVVAIIGHRKVQEKESLVERIYDTVTELIENDGADTFLFGSRSEFNNLCYIVVTEIQKIFPHIRRVYVRAERDYDNVEHLLDFYEETYFPDRVRGANELCYVLRNGIMIELCDVLLTYCDNNYEPPRKSAKNKMLAPVFENQKPKSGTQMAVQVAKRRRKRVINLFEK